LAKSDSDGNAKCSFGSRAGSRTPTGVMLEIRPATVGKHLERIYLKLDAENRTAAASFDDEKWMEGRTE